LPWRLLVWKNGWGPNTIRQRIELLYDIRLTMI
jgi:hypothetical protein